MSAELEVALRRWKRRCLATWIVLGALLVTALGTAYVVAATDPTENIALSRNEVVEMDGKERLWKGTFWNHSDSLYTGLDAVILFLDRQGLPVGQAEGAADRLDPGETFHIEATLPAAASHMRIYRLRWTSGGHRADLGPYRPWPFGHVMDSECGDLRFAIGACTPQRERD